jgi:uncharacterized OB-fold protein
MEETALSRIGKLYAFTTIRVKPPHYVGQIPYIVGIVELPEGERIRALLTECDQNSLNIGMEMELIIESVGRTVEPLGKIEVGEEILGWKFKPLRRSDS